MANGIPECPDCGCRPSDHNAVNEIGAGRLIAHCGGCGGCWRSEGTPFVQEVLRALAVNYGAAADTGRS